MLDFIRGIVRPALTLGSGGAIIALTLLGKPVASELWLFFGTVSGFTFAERAIGHAKNGS